MTTEQKNDEVNLLDLSCELKAVDINFSKPQLAEFVGTLDKPEFIVKNGAIVVGSMSKDQLIQFISDDSQKNFETAVHNSSAQALESWSAIKCYSEMLKERSLAFPILDKPEKMILKTDLEASMGDKISELLRINEDLGRQLQTKDDFIDIVSHDIRSPLGVVSVSAEYLLNQSSNEELEDFYLSGEQKDFLGRIVRNSDKALAMVSSLLDIGKLSRGIELDYEEVEIKPFLYKVVDSQMVIANKRGLKIEVGQITEGLKVSVDPNRFMQIIDNFVNNAIKFSPMDATITIDAKKIDKDGKGYIQFEVHDEGIGIPTEKLNSIFQKYQQLDDLDAAKELGVGLGLSIAQQFAKMHHATIEVRSEEGKGSTFSVTTPIDIQPEDPSIGREGPGCILVVEDDPDILAFSSEVLEDEGYHVVGAVDGIDGYEKYKQYKPDLVLCDIKMPKSDGIELLTKVKSTDPDQAFILCSGFYLNINDDLAKTVFKADSILAKPYEVDELIDIVGARLEAKQA